ncbi:hypothetical protein [Taylorella asinigenitalis]|uniref:Putative phage protein n=1 Tax=Taylorella asinigenitalis (strain MCE3) TaxID=1008459 RepID=G4QCU0_TAYAM|nr:hypothetical protein [Taylorella asinigenitalis]AEP36220.1 putative phage protein [Taylorella asinigenitalis MCE3]
MGLVTCENAAKAFVNSIDNDEDSKQKLCEIVHECLEADLETLKENLESAIDELNAKLKDLKDTEVALNAANIAGNRKLIDELKDRLAQLDNDSKASLKNLADKINDLLDSQLTEADVNRMISEAIDKLGTVVSSVELKNGKLIVKTSDGKSKEYDLSILNVGAGLTGNGVDKTLNIKLSKASDNILEIREDGLYAGITGNSLTLFVDSANGSDNNTGTKEHPLATLDKAFDLVNMTSKNGYYVIYLKAGLMYHFSKDVILLNATVVLSAYGDEKYKIPNVDSYEPVKSERYHPVAFKDYNRPTIKFLRSGFDSHLGHDALAYLHCKKLSVLGIKLTNEGNNPNARHVRSQRYFVADYAYFDGVLYQPVVEKDIFFLGDFGTFSFSAFKVDFSRYSYSSPYYKKVLTIADKLYTSSGYRPQFDVGGGGHSDYPATPQGTLETSFFTDLRIEDWVYYSQVDRANKQVWGWTANWNPFNYAPNNS